MEPNTLITYTTPTRIVVEWDSGVGMDIVDKFNGYPKDVLYEAIAVYEQVFGVRVATCDPGNGFNSSRINVFIKKQSGPLAWSLTSHRLNVPEERIRQLRDSNTSASLSASLYEQLRWDLFHEAFHIFQDLFGWPINSECDDLMWILEGTAVWASTKAFYNTGKFSYTYVYYQTSSWVTYLMDEYFKWQKANEELQHPPPEYPAPPSLVAGGNLELKPATGYPKSIFWLYLERSGKGPQMLHFLQAAGQWLRMHNGREPLFPVFNEHFRSSLEKEVINFLFLLLNGGLNHVACDEENKPISVLELGKVKFMEVPGGQPVRFLMKTGSFLILSLKLPLNDPAGQFTALRLQILTDKTGLLPLEFMVTNPLTSLASNTLTCGETKVARLSSSGLVAYLLISGMQGYRDPNNKDKDWTYTLQVSQRPGRYQIITQQGDKCFEINNGTDSYVQQYNTNSNRWAFWYDGPRGEIRNLHNDQVLYQADDHTVRLKQLANDQVPDATTLVRDDANRLVTLDRKWAVTMNGQTNNFDHPICVPAGPPSNYGDQFTFLTTSNPNQNTS